MNELEILNVSGIECYEKDGVVYLKLEAVARGLGFTQEKNGVEYVRWDRVENYLADMGFPHTWGKDDFVPENIFYRLAMKANNETAEKFQAKVADEVIPSIRKHGAYMTENTLDRMINSPEFGIKLLTALKEEKDKRKALEVANSELTVQNAIMAPKADYFDDLVDRHLLTSFRDTAKELGIPPKAFVGWLLEKKYLYRDQKHKLVPYENKNNGLFEVRESKNDKTGWAGTQTLVTPKGRETFRLLLEGTKKGGLTHGQHHRPFPVRHNQRTGICSWPQAVVPARAERLPRKLGLRRPGRRMGAGVFGPGRL